MCLDEGKECTEVCMCSVARSCTFRKLREFRCMRVSGDQLTCTPCSGPETRVRAGLPFRHQAQSGCERLRWRSSLRSTPQSAIVRVPFCWWFRPFISFICEIVSTRTVLVEVLPTPRLVVRAECFEAYRCVLCCVQADLPTNVLGKEAILMMGVWGSTLFY
jgi:hypothetical protein